MSSITFQVIDLSCENADQSFFPPRVSMTTKSTTQIATVLGFPEYPGFASSPPKAYHTITWNGTSEQQLWYPAGEVGNPGPAYQVAGARFDYSGSSTIDSQGNYTSLYTKNLSSMCQATGNLVTTLIGLLSGGFQNYVFVGWIGPAGHTKCPLPGTPYSFVENLAVGKGTSALLDSSSFWGSKQVGNIKVSNFNAASATQGQCMDAGGDQSTPVFIALFEPVPQGDVPPINGVDQGVVWFFAAVVWNHNYNSQLSDEYTDAEALANAQTYTGNGATAQNMPRTTGFVSTFTNVVYTLSMSNLIVGNNYVASVDFWNPGTGVTNTNQIGFQATASTKTIVAPVPTPPPGQTIQVRNPRIAFA